MDEFGSRNIINFLENLETGDYNSLVNLFIEGLNYEYVNEEIPSNDWDIKDQNKVSIKERIRDLKIIAEYIDDNHKHFYIIYCQLNNFSKYVERAIGKKLLEDYESCLIIFTQEHLNEYHFINIRYNVKTEKRNFFRWLIIDDFQKIYTPNQRLGMISLVDDIENIRNPSVDELRRINDEAFDVEAVTKVFFEDYKKILSNLKKSFQDQAESISENECHEGAQQFLNRLMFLYFIQKKGWLNENKDYIYSLYNIYKNAEGEEKNFYNHYLKPLFFQSFNKKNDFEEYNLEESIINEFKNMPYLNGGLFEKNKLDELEFFISDNIMETIFDSLLQKYNFTIREDSPIDEEIAIDPEMLGKVYESLLLEEERGSSGIFYTPRNEIDFMCRQSLLHFLRKNFTHPFDEIIYLIYSDPEEFELETLSGIKKEELEKLNYFIDRISVLDHACGSGSFLVGMLNVLLEIKEKISINKTNRFELSKNIIFNSLYGVDIKNWAINVSYLRLWLKLILEAKANEIDLYNNPILPNLHLKIRQGDSLIQEIGDSHISLSEIYNIITQFNEDGTENSYKDDLDLIKNDLINLKKEFYFSGSMEDFFEKNKTIRKLELTFFKKIISILIVFNKKKIEQIKKTRQRSISSYTTEGNSEKFVEEETISLKIENFKGKIENFKKILEKIKDNEHLEKFYWDINYIEIIINGGFDIVIGNPPYIKSQKIRPPFLENPNKTEINNYKEKIGEQIERNWSKKAKVIKTYNYLIYFYYSGLSVLKEKGIFTFVTSNAWLDQQYGNPFKEFLLKNIEILEISETKEYRIFKQAQINVCISIFSKDKSLSQEQLANNHIIFMQILANVKMVYNLDIIKSIYKNNEELFILPDLSNPLIRIQKITQENLFLKGIKEKEFYQGKYEGSSWGAEFFRTPSFLIDLVTNKPDKFIKLDKIVDIETYLNTGGADDFFFLKIIDEENNYYRISPKDFPKTNFLVEREFVKPFIESPRILNKIQVDGNNISIYLLVLPKDYLSQIEENSFEVQNYINWGVEQEYNQRSGRISKGDNWIILPDQAYDNSEIIIPVRINENHIIFYNPNKIISHRFYRLSIKENLKNQISVKSLIASLNSLITFLFMEIFRNPSLGGGVMDITKPNLQDLIIINPILFDKYNFDQFFESEVQTKSIVNELGYKQNNSYEFIVDSDLLNEERAGFDEKLIEILKITPEILEKIKLTFIEMVKSRTQKRKK